MDLQDMTPKEKSIKREDGEFSPSVEMMVHDYDDERTLEEEEALGPLEDPQVELSSLQKESDMPLEDLMAMYGYNNGDSGSVSSDEKKPTDIPSELEQFYDGEAQNGRIRTSEDEDEDFEYYPDEDVKKKTIMIGGNFQARIPEKREDTQYEGDDQLIWDPSVLSLKDVEDYLIKVQKNKNQNNTPERQIPCDDEQALFLLLQSGHDIDLALNKISQNGIQDKKILSDEECKQFESGLMTHGKKFHQIQTMVNTKTVQELVEFYYWWKSCSSKRYDIYMKERFNQDPKANSPRSPKESQHL